LSWILTALGFKYALLLPVSALVGFVPTLIVVVSGKGPMAGVALVFIIPVPWLIGVFATMEGGVNSFKVIATLARDPAPGQVAEIISTLLVAPTVGMVLMAPSYILAILVSLVRSSSADPNVSGEGRG
jgi:hypothetical protein